MQRVTVGHHEAPPCTAPSSTIAAISTWPPRRCGIATYATNVVGAVRSAMPGVDVAIAAIERDQRPHVYGDEVCWRVRQGSPGSFARLAHALNRSQVELVTLQHEFGLYGTWGDPFIDHLQPFLAALEIPLLATLHTVLPSPTRSVRAAVQTLAARSCGLIVMTETGRHLLETVYGIGPTRVHVVPHGCPQVSLGQRPASQARLGVRSRLVISTFGLLDRRKGVDVMIDAMRSVARRRPEAVYMVIGATHPEVVAEQGESYRDELRCLVRRYRLQEHVVFVDRFLSQEQIVEYLQASDVYATPYRDPAQICSGTLAYALGAGKAIVSTPYLHAVEALADGRGVLVGFDDAAQLAEAVGSLAASPERRQALERRSYEYGRRAAWPRVGSELAALYRAVAA
jgi:glycosyltransferase involved in cell wall biosynthesis